MVFLPALGMFYIPDLMGGGKHLIVEQLLVGREGGVDTSNLYALGIFAKDNTHQTRGVGMQTVVVGGLHDAGLVEAVQPVDDDVGDEGWQRLALAVDGMPELGNLVGLHLTVVVVIRLEHLHQRVFLLGQGLIGLVDGEVVFGDDGAIVPWLAHLILELLTLVAGHGPHDEYGAQQRQAETRYLVSPVMFLVVVYLFETVHIILYK